jgi:hypothetical protein
MIEEISAKVILSSVPQPDFWFGLNYSMNLYRGVNTNAFIAILEVNVTKLRIFQPSKKVNAIELLEKELSRKRVKGFIGTGSMNDPYMPNSS